MNKETKNFISSITFTTKGSRKKDKLKLLFGLNVTLDKPIDASTTVRNKELAEGRNRIVLRIFRHSPFLSSIRKHLKKDDAIYIAIEPHVKFLDDGDFTIHFAPHSKQVTQVSFDGYSFGVRKDGINKPLPALKKIEKVLRHVSVSSFGLAEIRPHKF